LYVQKTQNENDDELIKAHYVYTVLMDGAKNKIHSMVYPVPLPLTKSWGGPIHRITIR